MKSMHREETASLTACPDINARGRLLVICFSALFFAAGCSSNPKTVSEDPYELFRFYIESKSYHKAYLILDRVQEDLAYMEEGAAGYEYCLRVGTTAGTGQHEWQRIFEGPRRPLENKTDLVAEIHENALISPEWECENDH